MACQDEVIEIRIQDIKESLAQIRFAISKNNLIMADCYVLGAATQIKSLEHAIQKKDQTP